jgi:hypothetical protein
MLSLRGKSVEEFQAAAREFMAAASSGTVTQIDLMNFLIEAAPEVERICDEYGDTSERCANMKAAVQQLVSIMPMLPVGAPATYGRGTLAVVGLGGLLLGGLVVYLLQK